MVKLKFGLGVLNPPYLATKKIFSIDAEGISVEKVCAAIKEKWKIPDEVVIKNVQYYDDDMADYVDLDADALASSGGSSFRIKVTFDKGTSSPDAFLGVLHVCKFVK